MLKKNKVLNIGLAILIFFELTLSYSCEMSSNRRQSLSIAKSLQIEVTERELDFLSPNEVALDVFIKNISGNIIIVDYRSEYSKQLQKSGKKIDGIIEPLKTIDLLSFIVGTNDILTKELRLSNIRRHRNFLEEGELFDPVVELGVLQPGKALGVPLIVWSESPEILLKTKIKQIKVSFNGNLIMLPTNEVAIENSEFFGTILKNMKELLSKEYFPVSVDGRIDLK